MPDGFATVWCPGYGDMMNDHEKKNQKENDEQTPRVRKTIQDYESLVNQRKAGSATAEGMAMIRSAESAKPEGERICYDPYAIRFVRPEIIAQIRGQDPKNAEEARAVFERAFPGHRNSLLTRVRFFDDAVRREIAGGMPQVVIIGAGFDSRAYRIEGIRNARVFEVDQEETQVIKKTYVAQIFGSLPSHVTYIPLDLRDGSLISSLAGAGFDRSKKALFVMEGLIYYLPPPLVHALLSEIAKGAGPGSCILFDYFPLSMVDGTHPSAVAQNIRRHVASVGEPFLFGIPNEGTVDFLSAFGYRNIRNVSDHEYLHGLFPHKSMTRDATGLLGFCYAEV